MPDLDPYLDAYLARIGYRDARVPTLATLRGVVAAHAAAIPFENVDVLLGRPPLLDVPALVDKLVHRRRGGYCFEHNGLLKAALDALGFRVTGYGARVVWNRPDPTPGSRTHMVLRVDLPEIDLPGGAFLADVGFGGLTLTAPLRLDLWAVQPTPHEPHRLVANGGETELQARLGGDWVRLYHFSAQPHFAIDYEVGNWFTATHPASIFVRNLLAARPDADCRYALFNDEFTIHYFDGRSDKRRLADAADLAAVLSRHFHLDLPADEAAAVFAAIPHGAGPAPAGD